MNSNAALIACAVALCACSSHDSAAAPVIPARPAIEVPLLEPQRDQRDLSRVDLDRLPRDPIAIAATHHGLVAFDPGSGHVLGSADTLHQVIDIAHDPWRDRWIAAEYDDDSLVRLSVYKLVRRGRAPVHFELQNTMEAGGYSRVAAGQSSTVVFENDGLQQRWLVWDAASYSTAGTFQAPMPSAVVLRNDSTSSTLLSFSISDSGGGPESTMHSGQVQGAGAGRLTVSPLPSWSGTRSPLRAVAAGGGKIGLAQVRDGKLAVGLIAEDGQSVRETIQLALEGMQHVEDLVIDAESAIAMVALSDPCRLVAVDLDHGAMLDQQQCPSLPSGAPWFSRLIAYDDRTGGLIVAGKVELSAWKLSHRRTLEKVEGFVVRGARWPVALSASRSELTP